MRASKNSLRGTLHIQAGEQAGFFCLKKIYIKIYLSSSIRKLLAVHNAVTLRKNKKRNRND